MIPDRVRLPLMFDPAPLLAEALALGPEAWIEHPVKQDHDGGWRVSPLRGPAGETHPIRMAYSDPTATEFVATPFLAGMPQTRAALARLDCPLLSTRLMALAPGTRIKPHRDYDLDAQAGTARLHLPLVTAPEVDFRVNDVPVTMAPGELWYLRLSDVHSVDNRGTVDRVHLVIDVRVNRWLMALLEAGATANAPTAPSSHAGEIFTN